MVSIGMQYSIIPNYSTPFLEKEAALFASLLDTKRRVHTDAIRLTSITRQTVNVTSNDKISMSEVGFDDSTGTLVSREQLEVQPENSEWLRREFAPAIQVFAVDQREQFELYPAFGSVIEVDWIRERIYIELLESSLPGLIALPFTYQDKDGSTNSIPRWMREEGRLFEAWATLAERDPQQFYIGDFELVEEVSPEDIAEELRRRAEYTHEFRF